MQLRGLSTSTQENYVRVVRQLAGYYEKSPDRISEEELRQYFLYLSQVKKVSPSTFQIALSAIKFFYEYTLQRQWATLELVKPIREKKLPVVLSVEEVGRILARVHRARYRVCLSTIYACGLRLQEGIHLQVGDIDSQRMFIHVHRGKRQQRALCAATDEPAGAVCGNTGAAITTRYGYSQIPDGKVVRRLPLPVRSTFAGCNAPSNWPWVRAASRRMLPCTPCDIRTRPICSKLG